MVLPLATVCSILLPVGQRSFRDPELEHDFKKALTVLAILRGRDFMG